MQRLLEGIRARPGLALVALGSILLGAAVGEIWLDASWSMARRIAAGAVGGAYVAFLITCTRAIGRF